MTVLECRERATSRPMAAARPAGQVVARVNGRDSGMPVRRTRDPFPGATWQDCPRGPRLFQARRRLYQAPLGPRLYQARRRLYHTPLGPRL